MGRIKTTLTKRTSLELMEKHGDKFTDDFDKNKEIVEEYADIPSKKIRNIVAGFVTRLVKQKSEL